LPQTRREMSYLVLARKWRPQVFEDVIGQRPITQTLQNAISQKRVAHAFLFTGARGVGKTSTARILAKSLNCETGPSINPCNQCNTCHEISSGTSMDVIEIDGASNRGIDEIRELRENVRYTPAKSRHKIFIIDEVHMLTREAFNALLKTLEEPPPHIIFVFATTEPHKIPSTILSRCQRYDFKRIPLKEIVESLKRITEEETVRISQRGLLYLARESEGSMRDAQSLLDQVISYAGKEIRDEDIVDVLGLVDQKILHDTLQAIVDRDAGRCMDVVEQVYLFGYDVQHFCRELLHSLRNLILIKVSQHPEHLIELPDEELQALRKLAERLPFDHLNHLFNLLLKGEEEVVQSTFPRTMLEMTLIRMATLRPVLAIEDILKKLEGLERKGPPSPAPPPSPPSHVQPVDRPGPARDRKKELKETSPPQDLKEPRKEEAPSSKKTETPVDPQGLDPSPREEPAGESPKVRGEAWKELVSLTRTRNPVLGAFLAFGDLIQLSDDRIEIGFEKDSFHYERMLETGNRSQLEKICRDYLAKEAKLVISPMEQRERPKGRVVFNTPESTQNDQERPMEKGEGGNPLIQETLRLFNGRIVEG
jgi:DNA polymerase-3 subunit gamma/tau